LLHPLRWKNLNRGVAVEAAENKLSAYFGFPVVTFDSGRSALYFALRALGVGDGDEVLVQAYTCVVVINAIRFAGARPVYVDIKDDFTMDPDDARRKLTGRARALIIQHTFGQGADLTALLALARAQGLGVVEDAAHSFGARYQGKLAGTWGDIGMLSFGSDKVLSSVRGGALVVVNAKLLDRVRGWQEKLPAMPIAVVLQHLLHLPFFWWGKRWYGYGIGKWFLYAAKKLNLTNKIIYPAEKRGEAVSFFPSRLPNALACLLLPQINDAAAVNEHRRGIAAIYRRQITNPLAIHPPEDESSVYLRYTIRLPAGADPLVRFAKERGILLGDWYTAVIAPADSDQAAAGYAEGSCPAAERLAPQSVNLPTDRLITESAASFISAIVNSYGA